MSEAVHIRAATRADLDRVVEIESLCFDSDRFSRRQLLYLSQQAKGLFSVAEVEGVVAGYISVLIHSRRKNLRIYNIAVDPLFRGRNVAGMLIENAKDHAIEKDLSEITLEVRTDNVAAITLYRKYGFEISSVKQNYYIDQASAYAMTLTDL